MTPVDRKDFAAPDLAYLAGVAFTTSRVYAPPRTKPFVAMADVEKPVMVVTTVAMRTMTQEYTVE